MVLPGADGAGSAQRQVRRGPAERGDLAGLGRRGRACPEGGLEDLLGVLAAGPVGDGVLQQRRAGGGTAPPAPHVLGRPGPHGPNEQLDPPTPPAVLPPPCPPPPPAPHSPP